MINARLKSMKRMYAPVKARGEPFYGVLKHLPSNIDDVLTPNRYHMMVRDQGKSMDNLGNPEKA